MVILVFDFMVKILKLYGHDTLCGLSKTGNWHKLGLCNFSKLNFVEGVYILYLNLLLHMQS